jgi:VWFA-related protein
MARRNQSRKPAAASVQLSLTFGLIAVALSGLTCAQQLAAQTRSDRRTAAGSSQRAKPKPTPTSTRLETLGDPPPVPVLKQKKEVEIKPGDVISVNTSEVMLPVTVRDSSGRLVSDLTRRDFSVFEEGREQPLSDLALRQVPVDIVLMVDASSSVASNLDDFRSAVEGFATKLAPEDRISLIKFDDRVELLQDWTQSKFQLHRALNRIQAGMFTRFNDALLLAARDQFVPSRSRRAVIVLTDGIDSGRGTTTFEAALQGLLQTQVTVYVVSNTEIERAAKKAELDDLARGTDAELRFNQIRIDDLREGLRVIELSEERLAQLTTATGGRLYKPASFDALDATYAEVADELRHQYSLYYTPLNRERDGSFRRVRVETATPAYHATTRTGYYAPRD